MQISLADNIRPYAFVLNCNIAAIAYHRICICNSQFINASHTTKNPIQ